MIFLIHTEERKGFGVREGKQIIKIRGKWEICRRRTQEKKVISVEIRLSDDRFSHALNYDSKATSNDIQ